MSTVMKPRSEAQQKKLNDRARLSRAWKEFHRAELEQALTGVHGAVLERLMAQLKNLRSARELIAFITAQDWASVDANTRLIARHEINAAITKLRERANLTPIDDPLPGQPENAFRMVREIINQVSANSG